MAFCSPHRRDKRSMRVSRVAGHYGDWLAPTMTSVKAKLAVKITKWSQPGLLEQGMPFWPLLQPLGREDAGVGAAMSLAFLIAGRSDALPKASMATFFRARVVASLLIAALLYYIVVVLHFRYLPTRPLGRGPMPYQEGHRFWPSFSAIAHDGDGAHGPFNPRREHNSASAQLTVVGSTSKALPLLT